ncbi:Xylose isomerase domain protein TIM barrel [Thermobaculum terrenum ATCC BAA-798]|uniref:Xylose isomerase domain protein TIM barrel n=1 Tax=Thermobaculum terrenum (strain ATCC BAA-798 / CCMEE 7001 / YNP1) TaxID=525904 RepID=D1CCB2_THET1|nr:sugar phosphate isomerase/epimerase [Thermobaculum terrenum]ACZ42427.1 Xylose isomerase domain protein TIM barrel [Thermobaculum terrenum ATCC BAA-798]
MSLNVSVGTAPINWNNVDVPGYRPPTPYEQMLDEMAQAGYEGTEIGRDFPTDPNKLLDDLARRGLRPASQYCPTNLRVRGNHAADIELVTRTAKFLNSIGVDVVVVADSGSPERWAMAGHVPDDAEMGEDEWLSMAEGLHKIADACAQLGVRVAFHNHAGTYVETERELDELMSLTDPYKIGLCLDVGHLLYGGGDVLDVCKKYGDRIIYVHLKDVDMGVLDKCKQENLGFREALYMGIFTEFGKGGLDFRGFFNALDEHNYSGWIIVEQDTTKLSPLESARHNRQFLRENFGI